MIETSKDQTLYIIDGHAQIFRAYHAIRGGLTSPVTGEPTNATFGFVGMLLKLWRDFQPSHVVVTLDLGGDQATFRSELDPQYKANRDAPPDDLRPQVSRIVELCQVMGIPVLGVAGFEADDVIATLCHQLQAEADGGLNIRIVSKDKDLQQLLAERVTMFDIHTDTRIDMALLAEEKGITPQQVPDVLALAGDNIDNIPGLPGVGPKTAAKWIAQFGSIENLLDNLDQLTAKQRAKFEDAELAERLKLNRELVRLRDDAPLEFSLVEAAVKPLASDTLMAMFRQLGFARHIEDLKQLIEAGAAAPLNEESTDTTPTSKISDDVSASLFADVDQQGLTQSTADTVVRENYHAITTVDELRAMCDEIRDATSAGTLLSIDTETTATQPMFAALCGISLAWKPEHAVYIPLRCDDASAMVTLDDVKQHLGPLLEDASIGKIGQNIKYDLVVLRQAGITMRGIRFDTMVASYLIDATRSSHSLDNLSLAFLNYQCIALSDLIGKGKKQIPFHQVPLEQALPYAAEDADVVLRLYEIFQPKLHAMGMAELFEQLEMPMVEVLAELEFNGIRVDADELAHQHEALTARSVELRRQIIDTAGMDFNPDSPKQLADVLFNQLGCRVVKRGKSGPSTDVEVLQKLAEEQDPPGSEVAGHVLAYRQLMKLTGTYLKALSEAIHDKTGRVHASFNQTVTATGRLSSSDPNLQNIPIRTDLGRQVRKAFIAEPGHVLLSADYSQIELRMLAHLSDDAALIEAFRKDQDIHAAVAAQVFDVPVDQVTHAQRSAAKMVNFGIVYGITAFGLARRLGNDITEDEPQAFAQRIIDDYKARYPGIEAFLSQCVEQAKTHGYVQTIMNRRRDIPQINARHGNLVALGKRMAINTVVQGSAADLIKQAMVNLHRRIQAEALPMKMLLQIHDELVFEVPADQREPMHAIVQDEMESAMQLKVPLRVELAQWGELVRR